MCLGLVEVGTEARVLKSTSVSASLDTTAVQFPQRVRVTADPAFPAALCCHLEGLHRGGRAMARWGALGISEPLRARHRAAAPCTPVLVSAIRPPWESSGRTSGTPRPGRSPEPAAPRPQTCVLPRAASPAPSPSGSQPRPLHGKCCARCGPFAFARYSRLPANGHPWAWHSQATSKAIQDVLCRLLELQLTESLP